MTELQPLRKEGPLPQAMTPRQEANRAATEFLSRCPELLSHIRELEQMAENPPNDVARMFLLWFKRNSELMLEFRRLARKFRKEADWNRMPDPICRWGLPELLLDQMHQMKMIGYISGGLLYVRKDELIRIGKARYAPHPFAEPPGSSGHERLRQALRRTAQDMLRALSLMQGQVLVVKNQSAEPDATTERQNGGSG